MNPHLTAVVQFSRAASSPNSAVRLECAQKVVLRPGANTFKDTPMKQYEHYKKYRDFSNLDSRF